METVSCRVVPYKGSQKVNAREDAMLLGSSMPYFESVEYDYSNGFDDDDMIGCASSGYP